MVPKVESMSDDVSARAKASSSKGVQKSRIRPGAPGPGVVYRLCSMCTVPKMIINFNDRANKPSPNCRPCERCYAHLHTHEGLSMAIVRANIAKHGGPMALLSAYKSEGLMALDLDLRIDSVIRKRAGRVQKKALAALGTGPSGSGHLGAHEHSSMADAALHLKTMSEGAAAAAPVAAHTAETVRTTAKVLRSDRSNQE